MGAFRQRAWRPTRTGLLFARLTAVVGMLTTVAVGAVVADSQRASSDAALDRRVAEVTRAVTAETQRYVDTINTVAAAAGAVPELTASAFVQIASPVTGMNLAGATSVAYLAAITDTALAAEQRKWRDRGAQGLVLQPNSAAPEHIFAIFNIPLDGAPRKPGRDVTESAPLTVALRQARSSGQVAISDPFLLARDRGNSPDHRQQSLILTSPVLGPADAAGVRPFRGWVSMGLRSGDFLGTTLDISSGSGVDVTLRVTRANGSWAQVISSRGRIDGEPDMIRRAEVSMVGRRWTLDVDGSTSALNSSALSLPTFLAAGLLVSLLAGLLVLLRLTAREHSGPNPPAAARDDQGTIADLANSTEGDLVNSSRETSQRARADDGKTTDPAAASSPERDRQAISRSGP